ncbi:MULTISPECIES: lantibiotic dehydratase [Streptomyces]|uniref:Lantibiotic dehydratase n=1 Tax=Streptomyces ramulosus TaxID=47762 RepID=A0ABW1FMX4_9ACTN
MSQQHSLFQPAGIGMLRAPVRPVAAARTAVPAPGADGDGRSGDPAETLRALAADPLLREAVEIASPALAGLLARVVDAGGDADPERMRRAARALAAYRLRMSTRATPFGLMAGVAPAAFDASAGPAAEAPAADAPEAPDGTSVAHLGAAHRRAVRPDRAWLTGLVADWEQRPGVFRQLRLVANALCRVRGDRLILPYLPQSADADAAEHGSRNVQGVSLKNSRVVAAVLELAHRPVLGSALAEQLLARFPGATTAAVDGVLAQLIGKEVLLTDARPPLEETDPLGHVLRICATMTPEALPERAELAAVQKEMAYYAGRPFGGGRAELRAVTDRMRRLRPGTDLLHVDVALDARVRLPAAVAEEAARAATLLWRLCPDDGGPAHLREYQQAFLDRYGTERAVPLTELLDPDTGLGAPAGYRRPSSTRTAPPPAPDRDRDQILAALAQEALLSGASEVVLDDDHPAVRLLAKDAGRPPESLELLGHLHAAGPEALARGDFRFVLANAVTQAGRLPGRFGYLFDGPDGEAVAALARTGGTAADPETLSAQVAFRPSRPRVANVSQAPRRLEHVLPVGCFADPGDPAVLDPRDLAVRSDLERLHLVERATGRPVGPAVFHVLNQEWDMPNMARFLCEIADTGRRRWQGWNWGGALVLPQVPRVRYGRTVLSPARWRPDEALRDQELPFARWWELFRGWQARWRVPDRVQVGRADRFVQLDLALPGHPRLLRHELTRKEPCEIRETPADSAGVPDGWLRGPDGPHHAEVVVPLRAVPEALAGGAQPSAARRPAPRRAPGTVHLPGGDWLHLSLYAPADRHDELLAAHLAPLLGGLPDAVDRWFFLRYADGDGPHLRLRFHGPAAALARDLQPRLNAATTALHSAGLTRRAVWDMYDPELERYGGPEAMAAAERVFHADSVAVLEHLRRRHTRRETTEPLLVAAAGLADLARAFHPADAATPSAGADWLLRTIPKDEERQRGFRERRRTALPLIDPYRAGPADGADSALRALWQRRAEATAHYGALLRDLGERNWSDPDRILSSLLHMHHNRLIGIDRPGELLAHAVARGAAQAHTDRRRHGR